MEIRRNIFWEITLFASLFFVFQSFTKSDRGNNSSSHKVMIQAHRGGAGLMPENTIIAMKNAIDLGVDALEMDLQITSDGVIVVCHDAYLHSRYAIRKNGSRVKPSEPREYIYAMSYDSLLTYEVGVRHNDEFPDKKLISARIPALSNLIDSVELYASKSGKLMWYNMEIETRPGTNEGKDWPEYSYFVDKCVALVKGKNVADRTIFQSFDTRALRYLHEKYPEMQSSYLVHRNSGAYEDYMARLGFIPDWISPEYILVDQNLLDICRKNNMKIVPWTVDSIIDLERLKKMKVDAIITNYPDRAVIKIEAADSFCY